MNLNFYLYDHDFVLSNQDQVIVSVTLWEIYCDLFKSRLISSVCSLGTRKLKKGCYERILVKTQRVLWKHTQSMLYVFARKTHYFKSVCIK